VIRRKLGRKHKRLASTQRAGREETRKSPPPRLREARPGQATTRARTGTSQQPATRSIRRRTDRVASGRPPRPVACPWRAMGATATCMSMTGGWSLDGPGNPGAGLRCVASARAFRQMRTPPHGHGGVPPSCSAQGIRATRRINVLLRARDISNRAPVSFPDHIPD
jgi:hypothetical protein